MAADPEPILPITARDVLNALSVIRRRKHWPLLQELEKEQPDLAEFVLEALSAVHHTLHQTGVRPRTVRRLQRQVQSLVLVCLLAPRNAAQLQADAESKPEPNRKSQPE